MKHIAFAVVAAAALAVIGPRISQGNPRPDETASHHALSVPTDDRSASQRGHTEPSREFPDRQRKPY